MALQELTGLKQSYGALKSAEQRFRTSREAVAGLKTTPDGEQALPIELRLDPSGVHWVARCRVALLPNRPSHVNVASP